ncbi:DsbA family protein [Streptomyces sp. DT24]|uniref:DsbA family protein n=1 Tax=unclassified Streptomyces TaxID=2593676 RepID=UPI0023B89107|nr:thioredoxin domain-containing protein [Streptomyces sp. AM 4-1-1]WEH33813.1 thioredoxin domain-containing protein [Streptomyces sp. AM 4-1-1]
MTPANTTGLGGTVVQYGDPEPAHVLSVYADLRCPYCKRMEHGLGAVMEELADRSRLTVEYHFATFIDGAAGGSGSLQALAALGAAADEGQKAFMHYLRALYAEQPDESDDAFADRSTLLRIAEEVEALRGEDFRQKVTTGAYVPWAREVAAAFGTSGVDSTPTVLLDGAPLPVINPMGYTITPEAFLAELPA